ncbi:glycosyltransferase family 2 protein [Pontibacter sp. SGAir0037]|uniref:glycosyltransferase family 2 protein n=1 Tax=Pontibacter sp. SGAir0037 TaxID=2571030 RepID=UPI0010CD1604|nr:glycosyltransferase family 2 protein [Pontibacter sp. SGAir0037]QCR22817.1 glycosyltransferase family 2 protein [Pontibacter sp. SGAir0037]
MIYIVIPVFNRKDFTRDCLLSLRKQTDPNYKVIVVDDGSTDGTADMLKEEFPEVTVLFGDGNLFWTASVNMGIHHALEQGADYVMTMNNDVEVAPDFIENTYKWAKVKPNAVIGALEMDAETREPIFGGEIIDFKLNSVRHLIQELPKEKQVGIHLVSQLPGRGLLIPRTVIDKIGVFDQEQFPHYVADYDYTHTAARHGFELYCNYDAKLYTYPEESGERKNRKSKNLKNFYNHLFDIKGGGNLRDFTRFTLKNCPKPYIPYYLANGYARRIFGYLMK